jgi:hypothetical protein
MRSAKAKGLCLKESEKQNDTMCRGMQRNINRGWLSECGHACYNYVEKQVYLFFEILIYSWVMKVSFM